MRPRASTGIIFVAVFLDLLGFGMVLPLMPLYATDPRFAATPAQIGWLMASYSIMQFICAPYWGWLSDRIGRRPTLLMGLIGSTLSYVIYGLANTLWVLFAARTAAGVMGANIAVAQAAMADLSTPKERSKAMGLIGAAFGLGFILGPAFGGWLAGYGIETAPLVAALITGLNAGAAFFYLPETRPKTDFTLRTSLAHPLLSTTPLKILHHSPGGWIVCLLMGGFITLFSAFEVTLPLWGQDLLHWNMTTTGWVFTFVGVVAVITQGGVVRRLVPKIGEKKSAMIGLLLVILGLMILQPGTWLLVLTALGLIALGSGLIHPSFSSLASLNTDPALQGVMMGLFQSMSALGRSVGPILGGSAYDFIQGSVFTFTAIGIIGVLLLFVMVRSQMLDAHSLPEPIPSPNVP
ncbi:MAG: MFS transporter [Magnetococcales bacterium]|nr:MFS transporter [Magnetococcales bacterium]